MRIACLFLPGFPLQVLVRSAPHLQGTSFAVVAAGRIVAASRRATEAGAAVGMTAARARAVAPEAALLSAARGDEATRALVEAARGLSMTVDGETEGVVYLLVPPRAQGFGDKLLSLAARMGFIGRVGIADNRFTAWAATQATPHVRVRQVPAGAARSFLAELPLSLLPLSAEVRRILGHGGVATIGDFAALPPPSLGGSASLRPPSGGPRRQSAPPRGALGALALARGEDATPLEATPAGGTLRETMALEKPVADGEALSFVMRPVAERVAARLVGRGLGATRVAVRLGTHEIIVTTPPTQSPRALLDAVRAALATAEPVTSVEMEVLAEGEVERRELELFRSSSMIGS